ncbi:MAG: hypothetical protein JW829_07235 [Pirellulales bacterium]|nr:hypothetical protein [Pirellulales bacterium]
MHQSSHPAPSLYSQVDVSPAQPRPVYQDDEQAELLRDMLTAQDRTNELLEELVNTLAAAHKQRVRELKQWKEANPELARSCRLAAEALSRVQIEYLDRITEEINNNAEDMAYGEFVFNEFVDRFGPRLAQLNGVIQTLAQLSGPPNTNTAKPS